MSNKERKIKYAGLLQFDNLDWFLRFYFVQADENEIVNEGEIKSKLSSLLREIDTKLCTTEFSYQKAGFAFVHFGRRGVTISIWHWAEWDGTWELFNNAWYCYGRNIAEMELLDRKEPVISHYDLPIILSELASFKNAMSDSATKKI